MTRMQTTDTNRWAALVTLCVGMLMIVLDVTVVNVALPTIQEDLGFSQANLAWVVNAYLIPFGGLLLLAGRLGDLLSRRGVFLAGLAVFTVASVLCGLASTQGQLIAGRFIQGVGGAMSSAVILGMIVTLFPEPRERAKAIGVFAFVASGGGSIGLLAGGALTGAVNWHWVFAINVPIGIATAVAAVRLLEVDRGLGLARGADALGAVLVTSALMLLVYTIVEPAATDGWGAGSTLAYGAGSLVLLAAFVARELTAPHPLVPLRILRSRNLSAANLIQLLAVPAMFGMFFLGALYLEQVLGYGPMEIGLSFLPATVIMGALSFRYSERLVTRHGIRRVLIAGLAMILCALLLFTLAPTDGEYVAHVLPVMVLFGFGAGLAFPPLMNLAMLGVDPQDAGLASGLVNTTAQVGGALGLAVLATLATDRAESLGAGGASEVAALNGGFHLAYVIGAGLIALALVVAVAMVASRARLEAPRALEPA